MLLKGKNIILTGAGRGIGKAIAEKLASQGANLCLISRTQSELKAIQEFIEDNFKESISFYIVCDISDTDQLKTAVSTAIQKFDNSIDVLINNAGIQEPIGEFKDNNFESWLKNLQINLIATVFLCKQIIPYFIQRNKGKIINFSGGGSTSLRSNFSSYAVSKTAVVKFTETIASELSKYNIDVNAVSPGAINTSMLDEILMAGSSAGSEYLDAQNRKVAGGNDINYILDLTSFLCSEQSDNITGKLISAPWDDWKSAEFQQKLRTNKDVATLRRIDNKTFFKKEN